MALKVSSRVAAKLVAKHSVSVEEIEQCFATRRKGAKFLQDTREEHATDPPTLWFVSDTYHGRKLKVVFMKDGGDIILKTAYPANDMEIRIYNKYGLE